MQHLFHRQDDLTLLPEIRVVFVVSAVAVNEPVVVVTVNTHLVRHQRIQPQHLTTTVADDLCIGVAVEHKKRTAKTLVNKGFLPFSIGILSLVCRLNLLYDTTR